MQVDIDTLKCILVRAKHFDTEDIIDTQTYIEIYGQTRTRIIQATLEHDNLQIQVCEVT